MIVDILDNAAQYYKLSPYFEQAFSLLKTFNISDLPEEARIEINGNDAFCMLSCQKGKKAEDAKLEFHNKYIDIHFTISGNDTIGWRSVKDCTQTESKYDAEKDFGLFSDLPENWITVNPGKFAIFFPEDAHAPLVSEGIIHKAVIKIAINSGF